MESRRVAAACIHFDTGRLRRVIEIATREAGWGRKLPKGGGLGLAAHYSFVELRGRTCVEVRGRCDRARARHPTRRHRIRSRPWQVYPDRIRSQLEGAVIMGVSLGDAGRDYLQEWVVSSRTTSTPTR